MFKSFLDSAQDWIAIKDLNGRYITVNKILADSYGLKPEDFIGKKPDEFLPEEVVKVVQEHDDKVRREDTPHRFDEVVPLDGVDHYFQTIRFPLKNPVGQSIGTCTIKRDVSKEKDLTDQLVQAAKMAEIGKLSAGVAHEINNPLTGILAYTEDILESLPPDEPLLDDLRVILREAMRCRSIVRNLLDFARQEKPRLEKLNPNQVIDNTLALIEKLPQFRDVSITKNLAEDIPPIQGDLHQLQQVILNLLSNSAEAMNKSGNIKLSTSLDGQKKRCLFTIEDDGPGIPESARDMIFKPFYSTKGTNGLGLAVSWGIIERHRGTIEIDDAQGGGAVLRVILPVY
jgi:PAS domain S-box-containing protein